MQLDNNLSRLNGTALEKERVENRQFSILDADEQYRPLMQDLYPEWDRFNQVYFGGVMHTPHLVFGRTAPRSLSHCSPTTGYGGVCQITLNDRMVFGPHPVFRMPYPGHGTRLFIIDQLLARTVHQCMLEIEQDEETGYRGFGTRFTAHCNRIGDALGLPHVVPKSRDGSGLPTACHWPYNVRPEGYYGGDVDLPRLLGERKKRRKRSDYQGLFGFFLQLLAEKKHDRLRAILERQVDQARERRSPAMRRAELGETDHTGRPIRMPIFSARWTHWGGGCVLQVATSILSRRTFEDMPVLADALEEAGCVDNEILAHCRAKAEHTSSCFVLHGLIDAAKQDD